MRNLTTPRRSIAPRKKSATPVHGVGLPLAVPIHGWTRRGVEKSWSARSSICGLNGFPRLAAVTITSYGIYPVIVNGKPMTSTGSLLQFFFR